MLQLIKQKRMEIKSPNPATIINTEQISPILEAWLEISHLKQLYRQGWLKRGIPKENCESVADHSFGTAILTMLIADALFSQLNKERLLRMALIHELGEVYVGDITPNDGINLAEKLERERAAVSQICEKLPDGSQYIQLWEEYALNQSPEARFIHQIDRLEMGLQAGVYQAEGHKGMQEFFESAKEAIENPALSALLSQAKNFEHNKS